MNGDSKQADEESVSSKSYRADDCGDPTDQVLHEGASTVMRGLEYVYSQLTVLGTANGRQEVSHENAERCIHDLIHQRAVHCPDAPAVCFEGQEWSYEELEKKATILARILKDYDVGPESIVPFCFDKSAWTVVAILAILKTGAAFAAMDPAYPRARLERIIQETAAKIVLTQAQHLELLSNTNAIVLTLDEELVQKRASLLEEVEGKSAAVQPSNLAYVAFTSGSTGKPKGILIEHRAFVASARAHGVATKMNERTRALQFASYSFDVSVQEILTTLIYGGCICVPTEYQRRNDLESAMNELCVNWAKLTPTVVQLINPSNLPGLKTLVVGGEAITQKIITDWSNKVALIVSYGPAECSVISATSAPLSQQSERGIIGRPTGTNLWIVNAENHDELITDDGVGELVIEGKTLARGYLNGTAKDQASFIKNPRWAAEESGHSRRMYKSGDLVRRGKDGLLYHIGRKDHQVKINGQRVELGEIECHLLSSSAVQYAIAVIPQNGPWKSMLVAVLMLQGLQTYDKHEIRISDDKANTESCLQDLQSKLYGSLPVHMIPRQQVVIESMPLLPSGKIDRSKLKRWLEALTVDETDKMVSKSKLNTTPATPMEIEMQKIWQYVLNRGAKALELDADLYSIGGDSISAMQIVAECRKNKISITVKDILTYKSITGTAKQAESKRLGATTFDHGEEDLEVLFDLSPIQMQHFNSAREGQNHYNQSFFIKLAEPVSSETVQAAVHKVVVRHSMLRARFLRGTNGIWKQKIVRDVESSYDFAHELVVDRTGFVPIIQMAQSSINITEGPIFNVRLLEEKDGQQSIFLVAHHLVMDLHSGRILLSEIEEYLRVGSINSLQPYSFQAWSKIQRQYAQSLDINDTLPKLPNSVDFSYWGLHDTELTYAGLRSIRWKLDKTETASLVGPAQLTFKTHMPEMLIAAILHAFVIAFPDRGSPAIYTEGHGREPFVEGIDLSTTIGWFTTMIPVQVTPGKQFTETLQKTKDHHRSIPGKGLPYFSAKYLKNDESGLRTIELQEILLNYTGAFQQLERKDGIINHAVTSDLTIKDKSTNMHRAQIFEISVTIQLDELHFHLEYPTDIQHQGQIEQWMRSTQAVLQEASRSLPDQATQATASDFPLMKFDTGILKGFKALNFPPLCIEWSDVEDIYPCSPIQNAILTSQSKDAQSYQVKYHVQLQSNLGVIDLNQMQKTWEIVISCHPILRTVFVEDLTGEGFYCQILLKRIAPMVQVVHYENLSQMLSKKSTIPFKAQIPHRITLCYIQDGTTYLRLELSHAITDGHSSTLLLQEISRAYSSQPLISSGSYRDFLQYIKSSDSESDITYWKDFLTGLEPSVFTPLGTRDTPLGIHECVLRVQDFKIHEFCQQNGISIANLFQTTWALVLRAYLRLEDVCFGYLASGRDTPLDGIQESLGPYITMMVGRVSIDHKKSALDHARQIQKNVLDGLSHQHCSLADIQHKLKISGNLFNTMVDVQKRLPMLNNRDLSMRIHHVDDPTEFGVILNVEDTQTSVEARLTYQTTLLSDDVANNIAETVITIISQVLDHPDRAICDMDLFSPDHAAAILKFNKELPTATRACAHDLIEQTAQSQPHSPALCSLEQELSYSQVMDYSSKLAGYLVSKGARPGTIIPICMPKSIWAAISMLAIIKAGAAFVPLDPRDPLARMRGIVSDVLAKIVITSSTTHHIGSELVGETSTVDVDEDVISSLKASSQLPVVQPEEMAYIIFTSGSTGKPKGVVISHGALCSSMYAHGKGCGVTKDTRSMQFAAYTFDAMIIEILTVLLHGGTVCVPSDEDRMNNTMDFMNKMQVNWLFSTPSFLRLLDADQIPSMKTIVVGGEAVSKDIFDLWSTKVDLIHAYGPTETCVICVTNEDTPRLERDPNKLGKTLGSRAWIVSPEDHDKLVPLGSIGELIIEGPANATGYLNDTTKTARAFISPPTWLERFDLAHPNKHYSFYKTGDLVRQYDDGSLQFYGRADEQVKVNGQRLELSDVEFSIYRSKVVRHSLAMVPKTGKFKGRLVAILSLTDLELPKDNTARSQGNVLMIDDLQYEKAANLIARVRGELDALLPVYMVPTIWIPLRHIPMLQSGKLNRQKTNRWMTEMEPEVAGDILDFQSFNGLDDHTIEPGTAEAKLQKIWAQVLNLPLRTISPNKAFFNLGGDSISAMQVISLARSEGLQITVQDIFKHKTIADLAPYVKVDRTNFVNPLIVNDEPSEELFALSPIQQMQFDRAPSGQNYFNQGFMLIMKERISEQRVQQAFAAIVDRHSMLRARFVSASNGSRKQVIKKDHTWRFVLHRVVDITETQPHLLVSQKTINIESGPLFSVDMFQVADGSCYLYLLSHHLVIDLVSWRVIMEDLEDHLRSGSLTKPASLSFQNWIQLQTEYSKSLETEQPRYPIQKVNYEYWGLKDSPGIFATSTTESISIDENITSAIFGDSCNSPMRTEPVEILMAAIIHSFAAIFSDRSVPTLYTEGHGREPWHENIDISRTVGWFTTIFPLAIQPNESKNLVHVIKAIKDARRGLRSKGWEYFTSRYSPQSGPNERLDEIEILYNHQGTYQQLEKGNSLLERASMSTPSDVAPEHSRMAIFEISTSIQHGRLTGSICYPSQSKHQTQIKAWFRLLEATLQNAASILVRDSKQVTLSDYPMMQLDYASLDLLIENCKSHYPIEDIDNIENIFPCSSIQEGILLAQAKRPGLYDYKAFWKLTSNHANGVELERLKEAWNTVVARHQTLRTFFLEVGTEQTTFAQVVLRRISPQFSVINCISQEDLQSLQTQVQSFGKLPYHFTVCNIDAQKFCCLYINHALCDGSSMSVIVNDLIRAYDKQRPSPVAFHSDFINYLQKKPQEASARYWKNMFHDITPCLFPRATDNSSSELVQTQIDLGEQVTHQLHRFCQQYDTTISIFMNSIWAATLQSLLSMPDGIVCFGYLSSGRHIPLQNVHEIVGPLITMLVQKVAVKTNSTIIGLMDQIASVASQNLDHQHFSLARLHHDLHLADRPLFNTVVNTQRRSPPAKESSQTSITLESQPGHDPCEVSSASVPS